ncbi:molybdenum cofactor guanylyltransferase [Enhygromyxa salina]|uniref:molybdenum cofactor guanylyltransferase n=1 Tax=Enhygromyxa salina TaxID=215803 RepID=UPI0015E5F3DE|nr:molybdenum cofactor guanylyltransferase [Enhygromyxa salina]
MDGAVVLSGGSSARMGRDKAWLELDGRPLLEHVVGILATCCQPIVIAARRGQVLPELAGYASERVDDAVDDGGPLAGVAAGLERLGERGVERAYLGSCDAAAVSAEHVAFMLASLRAHPSALACVARDPSGRAHPLASAVVVGPMHARARAQLARGDRRLQSLFDDPGVRSIAVDQLPSPGALAECNTPAQWRAQQRALTRREPTR